MLPTHSSPASNVFNKPIVRSEGPLLEFEVGSGRVIKGFDKAVRGLSIGESREVPACREYITTVVKRYGAIHCAKTRGMVMGSGTLRARRGIRRI